MRSEILGLSILVLFRPVHAQPMLTGKIVGGHDVNIVSFPYQLSLQYYEQHICGASILSETHGVTAAHCVERLILENLSVYAGSNNWNRGGERRKLSSVRSHEKYDNKTVDYDIAVIQFAPKLQFNNRIMPVRLPASKRESLSGTLGFTTGWGYTTEDAEKSSETLRAVQIPVVARTRCVVIFYLQGTITRRMICAGSIKGGRDSCQGDSGGPFTVNGVLMGIVSWGYGCARPGYPGVYTNVAELRDWIKQYANV